MARYKIVPWRYSNSVAGETWDREVENLLNANAEQGWELVTFEEFEGQRYFYFKQD